ncbi:MAG: chemotaxis protein CheC [Deltaproteobacteria bacterium]|nr:chemotaxis protein CheC [Deltaproteobacteria bacterium]
MGGMSLMESSMARDALSELVNIGSGNAITSLTRLLGRGRVDMSLPEVMSGDEILDLRDLASQGVVVSLAVEGSMSLSFLVLFDTDSAKMLAGALAGGTPVEVGAFEQSALVEAVNIISCSFLGALASMVKGVLVPHAPQSHRGRLKDVVASAVTAPGLIALTNQFVETESGVRGRILMLADSGAATRMLKAIGVEVVAAQPA